MPVDRYSGSVIVNTQVLADKGLPVPQSHEDLLDPMYKGLIEMPDPTASSTGYLFLKSLVNAWGEEKARTSRACRPSGAAWGWCFRTMPSLRI